MPAKRFLFSSRVGKVTNLEDALLILSLGFCGTRWNESDKCCGFDTRFETTTMMLHRGQIRGEYKSAAVKAERTFQFLHKAADISFESVAGMAISKFHEM